MNPPKILQIAYYFPPIKAVGTLRNHRVYQSFKKEAGTIFVLTTSNRKRLLKDPLPIDERDITVLPTFDIRRLLTALRPGRNHIPASRKRSNILWFLLKLADSFPFSLFLADGGLAYIWKGYRKGLLLVKKEGVTHLYSSFRPYADHLIAWLIKGRFPHLVWIADFRDLHLDEGRKNLLFPGFQRWCTSRILKKADLVTTVSDGLYRHFDRIHPHVLAIRNGLPQRASFPVFPPFPRFTIAYTGSLYPGLQTARPLLGAIRELLDHSILPARDIQLLYAGKDPEEWKHWLQSYGLEEIGNTYPLLSWSEAERIQARSHINLLLSWKLEGSEGVLTAKLFHYLQAGRPILGVCKGGVDLELKEILAKTPGSGFFEEGEKEAVKEYVLAQYQKWKSGDIAQAFPAPEVLKEYSWENQFGQLWQWISAFRQHPFSSPDSPKERHAQP
jgi:hypothetical protein